MTPEWAWLEPRGAWVTASSQLFKELVLKLLTISDNHDLPTHSMFMSIERGPRQESKSKNNVDRRVAVDSLVTLKWQTVHEGTLVQVVVEASNME